MKNRLFTYVFLGAVSSPAFGQIPDGIVEFGRAASAYGSCAAEWARARAKAPGVTVTELAEAAAFACSSTEVSQVLMKYPNLNASSFLENATREATKKALVAVIEARQAAR